MLTDDYQATNQGIRFTVVANVTELLRRQQEGQFKHWHGFVAGGVAGAVSVLVNNGADVVKTRMQNQSVAIRDVSFRKPNYSSSFDCLRKIVSHEGFFALWTGATARIARLVPGQAITFGVFGTAEKALRDAGY